jgi:hypothetical protein
MYAGKLVFAQLVDHLPLHTFRRCVARYRGQRKLQLPVPSKITVMSWARTPAGARTMARGATTITDVIGMAPLDFRGAAVRKPSASA